MAPSRLGPSRRGLLAAALTATATAASAAELPQRASPDARIWEGEYWAQKGDVRLYMFRKRVGAPAPGAAPKPVVFLIHGSTLSGRTTYDLQAGSNDFSMMDYLARAGFDVWTMDHENYGRSSRTSSNSDVASGAADIAAGMAVIRRETGQAKASFYGASSGALRLGMFANQHPEMINRLVLAAFTYTGVGAPTLIERAKRTEAYRTSNTRPRDREMVASIHTRDGLDVAPALVDALVKAEMSFGDTVPSGTYLDMVTKLPLVDPTKISAPVLMIRGAHDGIATMQDVLEFYRLLPTENKQFAVIAGAHSLSQGPGYRQMWHAVSSFFTLPDAA